jgi:hypothetical protein
MLAVYSTRAAEPGQAAWLQRLLGPLRRSLNLQRLPPLEIRPTGRWGGWCADAGEAPDGRVSISSKISFFSTERVVELYIHELSHRLLERRSIDAHGPEFLCINAILLMRAAPSFELDSVVSSLSFYDCNDQPQALLFEPGWRSIVIDWALAVADELAPTTMAAENLAEVVCARWLVHMQELDDERQQAAQTAVQEVAQVKALKSSRALFAWLGGVGWVALFGVSVVLFNL